MNGAALYELFSELLSGLEINSTLFYSLLNTARRNTELLRYWRKLRRLDSSKTVGPTSSFSTRVDLPDDFVRYLPPRTGLQGAFMSPVQLVDASGTVCFNLREIPLDEVQANYGGTGVFAVDYDNDELVIVGIYDQQYTVHQHYQRNPGDITASTGWVFEDLYARMLVHDAAAMYELGADYDDQNARMGNTNAAIAERTRAGMIAWDSSLTLSSLGH